MKLSLLLCLVCSVCSTLGDDTSGEPSLMERFMDNLYQRWQCPDGKRVVCYVINWGLYRTGIGKFTPDDIDPSLCTNIVYAFATLNASTLLMEPSDPNADLDNGFFKKTTSLRKKGVKVSLALGGWSDSQGPKYSLLFSDPRNIVKFALKAIDLLPKYGFEGIDFDYEFLGFPQGQEGNVTTDRNGFTELIKFLCPRFKQRNWVISVAIPTSENILRKGYDFKGFMDCVDWVGLMAYDLHGSWDGVTGHHSILYAPRREISVNNTLAVLKVLDVPMDKVVLGIPAYARVSHLRDPNINGVGAPTTGPGNPGPYTQADGVLALFELCLEFNNNNGWKVKEDDVNAYAYSGNQWASYVSIRNIKARVDFVYMNGLAGVMVWELSQDDFRGTSCNQGKYPLLSEIKSQFRRHCLY